VASGVEVRYSGRSTADELIAHLIQERYRPEASGILVVTDDIELSTAIRRAGGRVVRNAWLIGRLERQRLSAPVAGRPGLVPLSESSIGQAPTRSGGPRPNVGPQAGLEEPEGPRWSPGRGATRKRGNAHRRPTRGR
jgi:hypothetical protein